MILPGFYGKLPTAGDFVSRRLPLDFVRPWDRWIAQHLAPLIGSQRWPPSLALRFLTGPACFGPATGIVLQSTDKVGRRFPLSIVALLADAPIATARADAWFAAIEDAGIKAQLGKFTPDELETALAGLPAPLVEPSGEIVDRMVMWTAHSDIFDVDPDAPQPVLEQLFDASWETS
ncbi:type VI secretion system protein ImpM [Mesorhizobium albiziae]|uniref:Type VI secretion system protein ImpM n=2 Tax=Neomesorhizobium albiziae TaxID=335020 RepID=A0A1I4ED96_9HYPH|nr:type VI secretion system protein ImpM [Mesorhizobium albiziae]